MGVSTGGLQSASSRHLRALGPRGEQQLRLEGVFSSPKVSKYKGPWTKCKDWSSQDLYIWTLSTRAPFHPEETQLEGTTDTKGKCLEKVGEGKQSQETSEGKSHDPMLH